MGHSELKNESKFIAQDIIQHHEVVQLHIAISWLAKSPLKSQTTHKACQWAWEKQPAKADHSAACPVISRPWHFVI